MRVSHDGSHTPKGFTLVEVLIVVVILGILASIVVPQLGQASTEAVKSNLQRNLQAIEGQIELYKAQHAQQLPTQHPTNPTGEGNANNGWGILISTNYLREEPLNFYTGFTTLIEGTPAEAAAAPKATANGWYYETSDSGANLIVSAVGFNRQTEVLSNEAEAVEE